MDTLSAPIGQLLDGRYLVESLIARGGMATVYHARDVRLERPVAIKIAHPELARDREFVDRFIGEARAVAQLSSPNVVGVFDQGSTGDLHYIAMEYVPGPTLRELLVARGRLNPREALDIIERVLSGLAAAHDAGIIHRDVKPENVLLGNGTSVKVADFGLARAPYGVRHTKTGLLIGTAAYLAPEQVASNSSDERTDVYAVGVMLFELLTGQQPHTGETPLAVAYKHVNFVVPPPSSINPELPAALDTLVALGTSRDPDLRPPNARAYLKAIQDVRRGLPLPPASRHERPAPAALSAAPSAAALAPAANGNALNGAPAIGGAAGNGPAVGAPPLPVPATAGLAVNGGANGTNKTMVVPGGYEDDFGGGGFGGGYPGSGYPPQHRSRPAGGYREPRLQRVLFSPWILVVLAVLVLGGVAWWLTAGQYTSVPNVAGFTVSTARGDLLNSGLKVVTGKAEHDDNVQNGQVIRTTPKAGQRIRHGGTVTIIPSLGPVTVTMPAVTGMSLSQAQAALKAASLTWADPTYQTSTSIPANVVISTSPQAYAKWPKSKPVQLVVSSGQPLPNFVDQQIAAVQAAAQAGGYTINPVTDTTDTTDPAGQVTKQDPAPGTPITPSMVVTVTVAQGQPGVTVPDVRGMDVTDAQNALQAAGFQVQVNQGFGNRVTGEDPPGNSQQPAGTTITIDVGFTF